MNARSDIDRYLALIEDLFGTTDVPAETKWRQLHLVRRVAQGEDAKSVAAGSGVSASRLLTWNEAIGQAGLWHWLGKRRQPDADRLALARSGIAQMLLGQLAEEYFERVSSDLLQPERFRIEDQRTSRTDTDYRLLTADDRPLFRLNIKFHGTLFQQSSEYVSLAPEDCFALATYKIHGALQRQVAEGIPYVFLIISVPDFPRDWIEQRIPEHWVWLAAHSGRLVEERIASRLAAEAWTMPVRDRIVEREFRVISARRADGLLRTLLFERVHALRLRGFNRTFRGAEINMHLSLSREMISYSEFVQMLLSMGPVQLAVRLDRGEV